MVHESFYSMLSFAETQMSLIKERDKEWKQKIIDEWEKSKQYPRKKKKKVRKDLLIQWSILHCTLNIFDTFQ